MVRREGKHASSGFTLIELLVVIAIIGILAAMLLPTLNAVRCRSKEGAAQSQVRDMESAIKAYESDYASYPRPDDGTNYYNRNLVFMLARPGSRGTPYYNFKRDQQGDITGARTTAGNFVDQLVLTPSPMSAYPCFYSPLAVYGGTGTQDINMYYYNEHASENPKSAPTYNPFSYDMWTGSCVKLGATGSDPVDYGGNQPSAGQFLAQINNWK